MFSMPNVLLLTRGEGFEKEGMITTRRMRIRPGVAGSRRSEVDGERDCRVVSVFGPHPKADIAVGLED